MVKVAMNSPLPPGLGVDAVPLHKGEDISEFVSDAGADLIVPDASAPIPFIR
jgi:hypothetical protein